MQDPVVEPVTAEDAARLLQETAEDYADAETGPNLFPTWTRLARLRAANKYAGTRDKPKPERRRSSLLAKPLEAGTFALGMAPRPRKKRRR